MRSCPVRSRGSGKFIANSTRLVWSATGSTSASPPWITADSLLETISRRIKRPDWPVTFAASRIVQCFEYEPGILVAVDALCERAMEVAGAPSDWQVLAAKVAQVAISLRLW